MTLRRGFATALLAAALTAAAALPAPTLATSTPVASTAAAGSKVVFFDMFEQPHVKPKRIFLTANAGQYLKKLSWKRWGAKQTTATGKFISDCASCPPPAKRDAWVTMKGRHACKGQGVRTYRKVVVTLSEPSEGHDVTRFTLPSPCPS